MHRREGRPVSAFTHILRGLRGFVEDLIQRYNLTAYEKYIPIVLAVVSIIIAIIIFTRPMKFLVRVLVNTAVGFVELIILNYVGAFIGISVGINLLNAVIVGVLGLPGLALLLILRWAAIL